MGPWIFGTCSSNTPIIANRRYLVWGALFPTNEGVPVANYYFIAVWALYCVYQPYWVCRSKVYLVHKAHIPPAVELKIAYMAKFGVPSFPQTRASLWQIMILWQFGPYTVCTSHIGPVGSRDIWYAQLIYPLLWNEKSRIWPNLWCLVPTIEGVPVADYDFMAVLTPNCMYHPYWVHGSKGYLVHIAHIPALLWNKNRVHCLVLDAVVSTNNVVPVADYDSMAVWALYWMCQPYWVCGSKGYLVHNSYTPCSGMKNRVHGQICGALFPQSKSSLWQIMISWQFWPQTACTIHIGSMGPKAIWYI